MYRKKIPFDINCGVKIAMEVIGGKMEKAALFKNWTKARSARVNFIVTLMMPAQG